MRPFGTYARLGASLVAVVELLLLAVVTDVVVGAGYPYFKVCNTFAQIGAALADAAPAWLCALGTTRRRAQQASRRCGAGAGVSACGRADLAGGDRVEPHRFQLLCVSHQALTISVNSRVGHRSRRQHGRCGSCRVRTARLGLM